MTPLTLLTALAWMLVPVAVVAVELPVLPQITVDTSLPEQNGELIAVAASDDFQAALDRAQRGDTIELEAGANFQGNFILPYKEGTGWIVIRSSRKESLPPEGIRVRPADSPAMANLVTSEGPVVRTAPGASHYRFVGVAFSAAPRNRPGLSAWLNRGVTNLILLSGTSGELNSIPHHIIFDRCIIIGDPEQGTRRGVVLNVHHGAVINSHLADFKTEGSDSQALAAWDGPGPFKITNNYLEAAAESIVFGGADPSIEGLVPADIEIRGNHFAKPLAWMAAHPEYDGSDWTIKNLFELKNARRVLVEGNLFEYNWPQAQNGFAILLTVRNQDGKAPWSVVEDVTFSNNIIRHVGSGVNILGQDDNHPSQTTQRILISNNLFDDVGGQWGGGDLFQVLDGVQDLVIENNTAMQSNNIIISDGKPHQGFVFTSNIVIHNEYGIIGNSTAPGNSSLHVHFPGSVVKDNVLIGASAGNYPAHNSFPQSVNRVGFLDAGAGNYRLRERGENVPGVNFDQLCRALSESERPTFCAEQ